jgi:hypothetical protein
LARAQIIELKATAIAMVELTAQKALHDADLRSFKSNTTRVAPSLSFVYEAASRAIVCIYSAAQLKALNIISSELPGYLVWPRVAHWLALAGCAADNGRETQRIHEEGPHAFKREGLGARNRHGLGTGAVHPYAGGGGAWDRL